MFINKGCFTLVYEKCFQNLPCLPVFRGETTFTSTSVDLMTVFNCLFSFWCSSIFKRHIQQNVVNAWHGKG